MADQAEPTIAFDVLLRSETDNVEVAVANVDKLRPPPEAIERCHRWLSKQGVTCHKTDFGLACEAGIELFERLFGTRVKKQQDTPSSYALESEPQAPSEIEALVSQITLVQPPTYFG